jgi:NADPH2:quinone reductase
MLGWRAARPEEARADIAEVTRLWQSGALRPAIHGTYPLTEIGTIHKILDERTHQGRLIAVA